MNAVLITGASSGIGECFARSCASQGKNLVIVARNEEKLSELKMELEERHNIIVTVVKADLSNVNAATKAYVLSLTEALRYEYKDMGIRFFAVCPGATDTHFFDHIGKMKGKLRRPEEVVDTTWQAVRKDKAVVCDGTMSKLQSLMSKVLSMKMRVAVTVSVGKSTWGS